MREQLRDRGDGDFKFHWTENPRVKNVNLFSDPKFKGQPAMMKKIGVVDYDRADDLGMLQVNLADAIFGSKDFKGFEKLWKTKDMDAMKQRIRY